MQEEGVCRTARFSAEVSQSPAAFGVPLTPDFIAVGLVYFAQGALGLAALAKPYLLKDELHLPPAEASLLLSLTYWPWVAKPVWGFISDTFPIFGSRRRIYLFVAGLTSIVGYLGLGSGLVGNAKEGTLLLMMLGNFGIAFSDVVVDALVVERARDDDFLMGNLQSYSWACRAVGAILSAYASGALLEAWGVRSVFMLTAILPILVTVAALLIQDTSQVAVSPSSSALDDGKRQAQQLWDVVRKPEIFLPVLFLFSWQASPTSSSAMFYFVTNEIKLSPEFLGRTQLVGAISSLAGIVLYNRALSAIPIRSYLFWVNIIAVAIGLLPLLLVTRMNLALGIPDEVFVLGDDVIQTVAGELAHMPILVLAARVCPPGVEATLFAFLMAVLNLSSFFSSFVGAALTNLLHVTESDFSNLAMLTLICNLSGLFPLALLGFVPESGASDANAKTTAPSS